MAGTTMTEEAPSFGELLRHFRSAAGFSQETLAERARVSVAAIGKLERGSRRSPHRETLNLIASALNLSDHEEQQFASAALRARARTGHRDRDISSDNLPVQLTSFVGRASETMEMVRLLEKHRLVTVTGTGGVGKTRTALEVAARRVGSYRDGIWFVELAPLGDGVFIANKIASTIAPPLPGNGASLDALVSALKGKETLLLLDNCEHLIVDAAAAVHFILEKCPSVTVLATSREPLGIGSEVAYRLLPLPLPTLTPETVAEARAFPALDLFIARAEFSAPKLALNRERLAMIADICRQLDGIPLAIELAVARLPTLGLQALRLRLTTSLELAGLRRDLPARQQTMLATIAWSHELLGEPERACLRRVAIFSGGHTLEAAEAVCSDLTERPLISGLIASLVDKSLVNVGFTGDNLRYTMFHPIRRYGLERLAEAGESETISRGHARWFAFVADRADEAYSRTPADQWRAQVWPDFDNARAALEWARRSNQPEDQLLGARIVAGLRTLWLMSGQNVECQRLAEEALTKVDEVAHPSVAARLLVAVVQSSKWTVKLAAAKRAIALLERLDDGRLSAMVHIDLASEFVRRARLDEADLGLQRASTLLREANLEGSIDFCQLLAMRALYYSARGDFDLARSDCAAAETLARTIGDERFIANVFLNLAEVEFMAGNATLAAQIAQRMLSARSEQPTDSITLSGLACVGPLQFICGDLEGAANTATDLLQTSRGLNPEHEALAIDVIAAIVTNVGSPHVAAKLLGFVDAWRERQEHPRLPVEEECYRRARSSLHEQLDTETLAQLATQGAASTFESVIDEAARRLELAITP